MRGMILVAIALLAALMISGCAQDPTVRVDVSVYDDQGRPVEGAYVKAYSNYSLGTGIEKWLSLDGTLTSTGTTKDGRVSLQILPGNYAFSATKDELYGGEEKLIIAGNNYVYITLSKPKTVGLGKLESVTVRTVAVSATSGIGYIELVSSDNPNNIFTYFEGDSVDGAYFQGSPVTIKVIQVIATSSTSNYGVVLELYDNSANLLDSRTANAGDNLGDLFTSSKPVGWESYSGGDTITGLLGTGKYLGTTLTVVFIQASASISGTPYKAEFKLKDEEGNLVDTQAVGTGENLADVFKDSEGNQALATGIQVDLIGVSPSTNIGYIEITRLEPKPKTGEVRLSLVDNATEKLIDVSSDALTMVLTVCNVEKTADSVFENSRTWSKVGECWTTANSNELLRVNINPMGSPLPIGDWNFTFYGENYLSNAAVFTLNEGQLVDQNVMLKKKAGAKGGGGGGRTYSTANPLEALQVS